jgi:hypothetical protein
MEVGGSGGGWGRAHGVWGWPANRKRRLTHLSRSSGSDCSYSCCAERWICSVSATAAQASRGRIPRAVAAVSEVRVLPWLSTTERTTSSTSVSVSSTVPAARTMGRGMVDGGSLCSKQWRWPAAAAGSGSRRRRQRRRTHECPRCCCAPSRSNSTAFTGSHGAELPKGLASCSTPMSPPLQPAVGRCLSHSSKLCRQVWR